MSAATTPSEAKTATEDSQQRTPSIYPSEVVRKMSRHGSALPLCMSRAQQEARRQSASIHSASKRRHRRSSSFLPSSNIAPLMAMSGANGWGALISCAEANTEVWRAIQMCSFYPSMRVSGTAFENSLNLAHRQSTHVASGSFCLPSHGRLGGVDVTGGIVPILQDDGLRQRAMSISVVPDSSAALREALEESRSVLELSQGSIRVASAGGPGAYGSGRSSLSTAADVAARTLTFVGGSSMVQMACAMKRAAMWEVVVVTALSHRAMEVRFRRQRLRRVLERHLLPTLLRRKRETGSVVPNSARLKRSASTGSGDATSRGGLLDDAGAVPQGTYLRDHDAFFDSLHNATLLQSFAETMTRERFLPGDIIARAGDSSQKAMYFLISGKCEVCTERWGKAGDGPEPADGATAADGNVRHHQRIIGGGAASRPIKEVIMAGSSFGGVFGGSALFASTYRALSQCIVWVLRVEEFEAIFRSFADRTMLDKYKEALRQHNLWWLQQWYHPAKCYGSIPIYRKLTKRMSSYLSDFTPVVKVRGETIFSHGDVAGDVYCMLEGTVLRRTKGAAGTYGDDGVAQRLGTNSFTALNVVGRYLMLGEEPHLVPGVQPYTCTVSSRVALFFKVSGERFVNALLDDPLFYAQLRGQLMRQRQENMRLHLECLAYVPLLQRFPAEKREELVQHARPRVIGRSVSLCDPGQHISDLLIIVSGSVRDPRHYNQKATKPLEVPASCEVENPDGTPGEDSGTNTHVRSGKVDRHHGTQGPKSGHAMDRDTVPTSITALAPANATARLGSQSRSCEYGAMRWSFQNTLSDVPADREAAAEDAVEWNFSFRDAPLLSAFSATVPSSNNVANVKAGEIFSTGSAPVISAQQQYLLMLDSAPLVYPDESEDINPALPVQPARRFVATLGGSWEALLLDKWPNGWESVTTVEMWAIPTRMLRLVYNSCTKPVQLSILNGLRHAQKEDLQLPTLPHTKLPPMSIYTHHGEAVMAAAVTAAKGSGAPRTKGTIRRGGDRKAAQPAPSSSTAGTSGEETGVVEVGTQHSTLTRSTGPTKSATQAVAVTAVIKEGNGKARLLVPVSARQTTRGAALQLSKQKIAQTSRTGANATQDSSSRGDETQASASARQAQDGRTRSLRRLREAATAQGAGKAMPAEATVDPALLACYDGVAGAADPLMLRIVRDPVAVVPPPRGIRSAKPAPASMRSAQRLPLIASSSEAASAAAWPTLPVVRDRWFHAVPSYKPLPGTAHGAQTLASPPVFAPNSTALASTCISPIPQHGKTLEGYVAYYAATVSLARPASRISIGGTSVTGAAAAVPAPAATSARSPSQMELGMNHIHLPKRRAYAV
ncbi:Cyclic_nucleotide-binding_domain_containing_protein_-_putative [Leishmania major strain Friedlin]|nr:Cyclic_nucleotide-binding_domain_containing_protein_-_putative [Leishmania major strain Friedlin]